MSRKNTAPKLPIRPHAYVPDFAAPTDHNGRRPCAGCSMWKENRVHDFKAPKDESATRILGEGE